MSADSGEIRKKLVIVGDGAVGKTCLLMVYAKGEFPREYVPTYVHPLFLYISFLHCSLFFSSVFDNYVCQIPVGNKKLFLSLWDTAGQEEFDAIRPFSYPNTDITLVLFGIDNRPSFENVRTKWIPELKQHLDKKSKMILVGTKGDLRQSGASGLISQDEGKQLAKSIGAVKYMECSAMSNMGVKEVFEEAIRSCLTKEDGCTVL
ncbi:putative Transforming protein RhoA [Blattamonas nauphoetae]|uniref:Transforming protein RhoA n=1 Tax=Blattamonas nauphoetae TaxID=2049346 RepID=A0ABQ9Y4W7_9EUKA|nr:putative Transforming protein RhoA [Blattamonas nauphoetae]